MLGEVRRNEFIAGEAASLGKTVHAFVDFNIPVDVALLCCVSSARL
jgi:hypothetical protein